MSEFKNGDLVLVCDDGVTWRQKIFIGMHPSGAFVCKQLTDDEIYPWRLCKPLPKKTYRPFKDVFEVPAGAWFRIRGKDSIAKIIEVSAGGCVFFFYALRNARNFQDLLENYEMSTDGKEWALAGVEE